MCVMSMRCCLSVPGVIPADVRTEAQRSPTGVTAEGGRGAADVRPAGQGEGSRTQGGREGGVSYTYIITF